MHLDKSFQYFGKEETPFSPQVTPCLQLLPHLLLITFYATAQENVTSCLPGVPSILGEDHIFGMGSARALDLNLFVNLWDDLKRAVHRKCSLSNKEAWATIPKARCIMLIRLPHKTYCCQKNERCVKKLKAQYTRLGFSLFNSAG